MKFKSALATTWQLAWPVMLANLSLPLLNLADAAILGHLDEPKYLAGVTAGGSLMAYVFFGFNFLSMGISGWVSQAFGAQKFAAVMRFLSQYLAIASVAALLVFVAHRGLIQLGLAMLTLPTEVAHEAQTYLQIRAWGIPAILLNMTLLGFFIGLQNTRVSLYSVSATQLLNIALNWLFVWVFEWQTFGIALGSVISEYLGLALVLWHFNKRRKFNDLKNNPLQWQRWPWSEMKSLFQVSGHLFLRTLVLLTAFAWFHRSSAPLGTAVIAANGLLLAFFTLISHFLDGIAASAEAQTGKALGRKDASSLRLIWQTTGVFSLLVMAGLAALISLVGPFVVGAMTTQAEVLEASLALLPYVALMPLAGGLAFWLDGIMVGAQRAQSMRNSVLLAFACYVPMTLIWGNTASALWLTFNAFFVLRSSWLLAVFYFQLWRPLSRPGHRNR